MGQSDQIDELFAQARGARGAAPADFLARVLEDALAEQPVPVPVAVAVAEPVAPPGRGFGIWLAEAFAALGGAGAVAGLATATVAGLWLGFAQPSLVSTVIFGLTGAEAPMDSLELLPDADLLLTEG